MTESNNDACSDTPETRELLASAKNGSEEALNSLLRQMHDYVTWVANQNGGADLRAKAGPSDIVQQSYVSVVEKFDEFRGTTPEQLRAWMKQIVVNEIHRVRRHYSTKKRNALREQAIHGDSGLGVNDIQPIDHLRTPGTMAVAEEQTQLLNAALNRLPEDYQEVIKMRNWMNKSFSEISEAMGKTENAVTKLWFRALLKLEEEMARKDEHH